MNWQDMEGCIHGLFEVHFLDGMRKSTKYVICVSDLVTEILPGNSRIKRRNAMPSTQQLFWVILPLFPATRMTANTL
jgi:hypothetical protein